MNRKILITLALAATFLATTAQTRRVMRGSAWFEDNVAKKTSAADVRTALGVESVTNAANWEPVGDTDSGLAGTAAASSFISTNADQGVIALEHDGDGGIGTGISTAWYGSDAPTRFRLSRASADGNGAQHFLITPYQYGIAFEYDPGTVEWWVHDFSVHSPDAGGTMTGRFWVGDQADSGGLFSRAWSDGELWAEIASQTFSATTHGDLRFRVVADTNLLQIRWGVETNSLAYHIFSKTAFTTPQVTLSGGTGGTYLQSDRLVENDGGGVLYLGAANAAKWELYGPTGALFPLAPADIGYPSARVGTGWFTASSTSGTATNNATISTNGFYLFSPNGTRYHIKVSDAGDLSAAAE